VIASTLYDISDPDSPNYGKWLTRQQVDDLSASPKMVVNAVKNG